MAKFYVAVALLALLWDSASRAVAFIPNIQIGPEQSATMRTHQFFSSSVAALNRNSKTMKLRSKSHLFFFRRREDEDNNEKSDGVNEPQNNDPKLTNFGVRITPPFYRGQKSSQETKETENKNDSRAPSATAFPPAPKASVSATTPALTPEEVAEKFHADAEKAWLEAEFMEAELTLTKLEQLEKELAHAKKMANSGRTEKSNIEELQREMDILQRKLNEEEPASSKVSFKDASDDTSFSDETERFACPPIFRDEDEIREAESLQRIVSNSPLFVLEEMLEKSVQLPYSTRSQYIVTVT